MYNRLRVLNQCRVNFEKIPDISLKCCYYEYTNNGILIDIFIKM